MFPGFKSRSAVLHSAVRLLRGAELGAAYEDAFGEWEPTGEAASWDLTAGDGLADNEARWIRFVDVEQLRGAEASKRLAL
jgi:hypothetical protein